MIFQTKNLRFRPIDDSDTDNIVRWRNTKSIQDHFIYREEFTREIHQNWLKTKVNTGQVIQFIIEIIESSIPIGSVYLRDINSEKMSAEFGIFIGEPDYFGKGYGFEATSFMIGYFFDEMKYKTLFLRVLKDNIPAIRCYEKSGFKRFDENDSVMFMSVTEDDYLGYPKS